MTELELQLLTVLRDSGTIHGIEIARVAENRFGRMVLAGSLYRALHRLESQGLIRGEWEKEPSGHKGPARRYYKITGEGAHGLAAHLLELQRQIARMEPLLEPGG